MPYFSTVTARITDRRALLAALADVGYGDVESHDEPQPLYGYRGERCPEAAHVIVRRAHVGRASDDIGFRRRDDGGYLAVISEYDRRRHDGAWLAAVTARHAYHLAVRLLGEQGYQVAEEAVGPDGAVRMVVRRRV